jgi:hypothetical protein
MPLLYQVDYVQCVVINMKNNMHRDDLVFIIIVVSFCAVASIGIICDTLIKVLK